MLARPISYVEAVSIAKLQVHKYHGVQGAPNYEDRTVRMPTPSSRGITPKPGSPFGRAATNFVYSSGFTTAASGTGGGNFQYKRLTAAEIK